MKLLAEIRARAQHAAGPLLGALAIGYVAFHTVHGDRGLNAYLYLKQEVAAAKADLAEVEAVRATWERKVSLLHPESLDLDMLDEQARFMLNYSRPEDVIILERPEKDQAPIAQHPDAAGSPVRRFYN